MTYARGSDVSLGWRETWCMSCGRRRKRDKWSYDQCPNCGAPPPFYLTIVKPIQTPMLARQEPVRHPGVVHSWLEEEK